MNPHAPIDPVELQQQFYFTLITVAAFLFVALTWVMKEFFAYQLKLTPTVEQTRFFRLSWAYAIAEALRDMQTLNIFIYLYMYGSVPMLGRIMIANLPEKANELILLISYLLLPPLIRVARNPTSNTIRSVF
jgi:hypothetical protein